jgi:hypothetical protein
MSTQVPAPKAGVQFSLRLLFILVFILALGLAFVLPAVNAAKEAADRMSASNNARQLALGMHNYHDGYRVLPPAVTMTRGGQPAYSWRFALLTWIEQIGQRVDEETGRVSRHPYHHVDQNLPWNDPANLDACQFTFPIFLRPGERNRVEHATNFVVVRGPGAFFPDDGEVSFTDVKDDPSTTILLVEIGNSDIPWYEPRDLHIEQMSFRINDPQQPSLGSRRSRGAIVAMADGSVRHLPQDTPPETIRAMLTIAGGETIPPLP